MIRRGQIWSVKLEPTVGSEANKTRPAVVVSNNAANETAAELGQGTITVVPLTSNTARIYPFQVLIPATETKLSIDSKAQAEQVRSIDIRRVGDRLGGVSKPLLDEIDRALRLHLSL